MSKFDTMYLDLCDNLLKHTIKAKVKNNITHQIPDSHWTFDLSDEFPILTIKPINWKTAILELMWIYQVKSNDVRWLQERNIHKWDKFKVDKDGFYPNPAIQQVLFFGEEFIDTVGTTLGYIVANGGKPSCPDQMDAAINKIVNFPDDQSNTITMYLPHFFDKAVLIPCVSEIQWIVSNGKLNSRIDQLTCDIYKLPFYITQYAAFTCMLAHVTGLKPGKMFYSMKNIHIYEKHVDAVKEMIKRKKEAYGAPKLWLNPEIKIFYDFDNSKELKDIKLEGYQHLGKLTSVIKP